MPFRIRELPLLCATIGDFTTEYVSIRSVFTSFYRNIYTMYANNYRTHYTKDTFRN